MDFEEYQHIVKWDDPEVDGITVGKCYIFPKIDGTNASLWMDELEIKAGSRRRQLSYNSDNANFYRDITVQSLDNLARFFGMFPHIRLFGEWLVPHTLKTYRDDAWRKFYIIDVMDGDNYLAYDEYKGYLDDCKLDYIPPLKIIDNPTFDDIVHCSGINTYLLKENSGVGEGVVVKNYNFVNQYGRVKWLKYVRSDFKDEHYKGQG